MNKKEVYHRLNYVDHSRDKRMEMAKMVEKDPDLAKFLIEIAMEGHNTISDRASWVLEYTAKEHIFLLLPYLDLLTKGLESVRSHPSVRPMAKICERLVLLYLSETGNPVQDALADVHLERITTP